MGFFSSVSLRIGGSIDFMNIRVTILWRLDAGCGLFPIPNSMPQAVKWSLQNIVSSIIGIGG